MRDLRELDQYRFGEGELKRYGKKGNSRMGVFIVPGPMQEDLRVIADSGMGWDHISVSLAHRIPYWTEMDFIARLFFKVRETAMQLHVPKKDHINIHPHTLHLWRPAKGGIPMPDGWRV